MPGKAKKNTARRKKGSVGKLKSIKEPSDLREEAQKLRRASRSDYRNKMFDAGCDLIARMFNDWPKGCRCGEVEHCQVCHRADLALQYWIQLEELDNDLIKKMIPDVKVQRQSRRREPNKSKPSESEDVITMSDVIRGMQAKETA